MAPRHTFDAPPGQLDCDVCGLPARNVAQHLQPGEAPAPARSGPRPPRRLPPVDRPEVASSLSSPDTSRAAAKLAAARSGTNRRTVLDHLAGKPSTDDEIEVATQLAHTTVSARRRGLVQDGWVTELLDEETDAPVTRPTRSGSPATVWTLTPQGRTEYRSLVIEEYTSAREATRQQASA